MRYFSNSGTTAAATTIVVRVRQMRMGMMM